MSGGNICALRSKFNIPFFPSFMQYVKLKLVHRKDVGGEKAGNAAARGGAAPTSPGRFGTVWSSTRKPNPGKKV